MEQICMLPPLSDDENAEEIKRQAEIFLEYAKNKRNWENAFQRWSDRQVNDGSSPLGKCGFGSMCDYCNDNSYGRPCVRALNAMCRETGFRIDYKNRNFEEVWNKK